MARLAESEDKIIESIFIRFKEERQQALHCHPRLLSQNVLRLCFPLAHPLQVGSVFKAIDSFYGWKGFEPRRRQLRAGRRRDGQGRDRQKERILGLAHLDQSRNFGEQPGGLFLQNGNARDDRISTAMAVENSECEFSSHSLNAGVLQFAPAKRAAQAIK